MCLEIVGIFATLIAPVLATVWVISVAKAHYRKKNTLEFINDYNRDKRVNEGISVLLSSVYEGKERANYIVENENRKDYEKFLFLMNEFEMLAIGLNRKTYDKKMIKDYFGYELLTIYKKSKLLIEAIRTKNKANSNSNSETAAQGDKAYEKFEGLAQTLYQNWFCNALSVIRKFFTFSC